MISLQVLVENTARMAGILGEHGLSYWLETGSYRVLFDTGKGFTLFHNAPRLGVDLSRADAVVLSHGHSDHAGGLEELSALAPNAPLFLHPDATCAKFSGSHTQSPGVGRRISTAFMEEERFRLPGRKVVVTREPCEVVPGIWMTGEIPRTNSFEDTGGPFFLDVALRNPDPLLDDQALYAVTDDGLLVVLGCAHSGVVNTLQYIQKLTGETRIHTLIGGLHLEAASEERIERTLAALEAFAPEHMGFCHCTGFAATARIWNAFPGRCFQTHAGSRLDIA